MKTFKSTYFTKNGNRKQSTIGRSFLLNALQNDANASDFTSSELFSLYGSDYARKTQYANDVVKKRFYSSLSAVKRLLTSKDFYVNA